MAHNPALPDLMRAAQTACLSETANDNEDHALQHLHEDLLDHVVRSDLGIMVNHRYLHALLPGNLTREYIALTNAHFEFMRDRAEAAAAAGDLSGYIFGHERPYRLEALSEAARGGLDMFPEEYWPLVAEVWRDSNNIFQDYDAWRELWTADVPKREFAMSADERGTFAALPESVEVWRGIRCENGMHGMSWTLCRDYGIWFAQRSGARRERPMLIRGMVMKADILAAFDGVEQEIVALPESV